MALKLTKKELTPGLRWVEFDKETKIQIEGLGNSEYQVGLERVRRRTQRNDAIFEQGEVGVLEGEKTEHQNHCALLAQFIVKDWSGVLDEDGNPLKFNAGVCAELLDSNIDFFLFVIRQGSKANEVASAEIAETVEKQ